MFYTYVIKSISHNFYYKGHCEDLALRLRQHNAGMTQSIKPYLPFEVVYFEEFSTRIEAVEREKYLKTAAGRRYLHLKINKFT